MARKITFLLLLGTYALSFNPLFAAEKPVTNLPTNGADLCDAPAPDNFQVEGINEGYVELTWTPAWPNATHTVVLYREDASGNWTNLDTYTSVPGDAYSVPVSGPGSYLVTIATNCVSGEASSLTAQESFKIIELTGGGRIPVNPQPASTCDGINLNDHHWVGFKVSKIGTNISNLFEITLDNKVKRVYAPEPPHQVVAVDDSGLWPINDSKFVNGSKFRVFDLVDGIPVNIITIGHVYFKIDSLPIAKLCPLNSPLPWKPQYSFIALTATSTLSFPQGFVTGTGHNPERFKVVNPIIEKLDLFAPESYKMGDKVSLRFFDTNGKLIWASWVAIQNSQTSLLVNELPTGIYFLQIETEQETQTLKVIKTE